MLDPSFFIFFCYYPNIIQIISDFSGVLLKYRSKVLVDHPLECWGCVSQPKIRDFWYVSSEDRFERSFRLIFFSYPQILVSPTEVELRI